MKLNLASGNSHKAEEFQALCVREALVLEVCPIKGLPPVPEDTGTFLGNARQKALAGKSVAGKDAWVMADDSGLCVDALGGAPGVESANYAGLQAAPAANMGKLLEALKGVPEGSRGAHFFCLLFLIGPDGTELTFKGRVGGRILFTASGAGGFGYDPLFAPEGHAVSLAELGSEEKNRLSHRARAWAEFASWARCGGLR